jgi:hypothetical protein
LSLTDEPVFTVDPPADAADSPRRRGGSDVSGAGGGGTVAAVPDVHPSEATYNAQIRRLWDYKRHLMQPDLSQMLRNSEVATQVANIFRKSLFQRGGKGLGGARSPAHNGADDSGAWCGTSDARTAWDTRTSQHTHTVRWSQAYCL